MLSTGKTASLNSTSAGPAETEVSQTGVPESVPHFKSFDHITDPRERRAKDYEQYLNFALDRFPEFGERIRREIAFAQAEAGRSKTSDSERIIKLLEEQGDLLREEIADDLELPKATVYKLCKQMTEQGVIKCRTRPGVTSNRPMLVYYL